MSKNKKKKPLTEIPAIGEPLENPNFPTPTGITGLTEVPGYERPSIVADPLGSWTGQPIDLTEMPVQDADDL
jgi:hypothetical protein